VFWSKSFFTNLNVFEATVVECKRNSKTLHICHTEGHQKPKSFKKLNYEMKRFVTENMDKGQFLCTPPKPQAFVLVGSLFYVTVNPVELKTNLGDCAFHCFQCLGFRNSFCLLQSPLLAIGQTGNCWPKNSKPRHLPFVAVFNLTEEFIACFMNVCVCVWRRLSAGQEASSPRMRQRCLACASRYGWCCIE